MALEAADWAVYLLWLVMRIRVAKPISVPLWRSCMASRRLKRISAVRSPTSKSCAASSSRAICLALQMCRQYWINSGCISRGNQSTGIRSTISRHSSACSRVSSFGAPGRLGMPRITLNSAADFHPLLPMELSLNVTVYDVCAPSAGPCAKGRQVSIHPPVCLVAYPPFFELQE